MEAIANTLKTLPRVAPISNAASASLAWREDRQKQVVRELEREEHEQACEAAVALRDATYGRERNPLEKRVEAQAMSLCLEEVPAAEILPLMQQEIQNRTNPYPPKAPDLLRRRRGEEWADNDGKAERVTVANASAYLPLAPTPNEIAMRNALPEGEGAADAEGAGRAAFRALGEKFARMRARREDVIGDREVLAMLHDACGMKSHWDASGELKRMMLAFGRWLLSRHPRGALCEEMARDEWQRWTEREASVQEAAEATA
jgi:hypothetical protein